MKENNLYPYSARQSENFRHPVSIPDFSVDRLSKSRFYKAYATLDRAEGACHLALIWQRGSHNKSMEVHHYLLHFNHEGIKEYWIEDITCLGARGWQNRLRYKTVQLGLSEAASLIQDAYAQNLHFTTKMAPGINANHMLFQFDISGVDRTLFNYRLFPSNTDLRMFVNIYLAALKRLDRSLLYDLASAERQRELGNRAEYLRGTEDEFSQGIVLRSGITSIQTQGRINLVNTYMVLSTPQEEIVRINYQLQIQGEKAPYFVLDFSEVGRETLAPTHPENPLNYRVFSTLYRHNNKEKIQQWLEKQPGVFLGGELSNGEFFKWLNGGSEPWEEFNSSQAISAEFILTDHELLVFTQRAESMAGIIRLVAEDLRGILVIEDQYNLEISQLFRLLFNTEYEGKNLILAPQLRAYRAQSFILLLEPRERERFNAYMARIAARSVRLDLEASYYLILKGKLLAELYSAGCWLKLTVYSGTWENELAFLNSSFRFLDIIRDYEMENSFDLFTPPLSEQRKWEISRQLHVLGKEAVLITDMGLVPTAREAGQRFSIVIGAC